MVFWPSHSPPMMSCRGRKRLAGSAASATEAISSRLTARNGTRNLMQLTIAASPSVGKIAACPYEDDTDYQTNHRRRKFGDPLDDLANALPGTADGSPVRQVLQLHTQPVTVFQPVPVLVGEQRHGAEDERHPDQPEKRAARHVVQGGLVHRAFPFCRVQISTQQTDQTT